MIAIIGMILLIGIVMKNAILMIDFALELERKQKKSARDAIYQASLLRFRPILMTTLVAMLGAVPLAFGGGMGAELRRPLGIVIIAGLMVSQLLTLFTTPVIYLVFDDWSARLARRRSMNLSKPFIQRPVATTLMALGIAFVGIVAFYLLPVASLPEIDFPTINVASTYPGASPEIMATSVAAPLEKQLGQIAGITQMTSASNLGSTSITLQFDLSRDINGAARDVQAAINAASSQLPPDLPNRPTYRKFNPAEAPIMILASPPPPIPQVKCTMLLQPFCNKNYLKSVAWVK